MTHKKKLLINLLVAMFQGPYDDESGAIKLLKKDLMKLTNNSIEFMILLINLETKGQ